MYAPQYNQLTHLNKTGFSVFCNYAHFPGAFSAVYWAGLQNMSENQLQGKWNTQLYTYVQTRNKSVLGMMYMFSRTSLYTKFSATDI
jgi:hypothetical protein